MAVPNGILLSSSHHTTDVCDWERPLHPVVSTRPCHQRHPGGRWPSSHLDQQLEVTRPAACLDFRRSGRHSNRPALRFFFSVTLNRPEVSWASCRRQSSGILFEEANPDITVSGAIR